MAAERLQRSKGPQRQATRPRSVYRYSRGSSCAVSQNTLRSKLFVGLLSVLILCKLLPYKETRKSSNTCVLTICGFFDTLKRGRASPFNCVRTIKKIFFPFLRMNSNSHKNHGEAVYIIKTESCISSIPLELYIIIAKENAACG